MQDFHQLASWTKAHKLVLRVYQTTDQLPDSEHFGLVLQLRRSATNIATRIAEGTGRDSNADYTLDLRRARAAGHELEYLLLLSHDLGYISSDLHQELSAAVIEVRKMLTGLLKAITVSP